jgi:NAD(P)-dependent dehydrogenase (short-subunit alcohol dehydrogenase family)
MSFNPMQMEGRVVLVTGASSGIGRDTAILLSQLGARVVLAGRSLPRLEETEGLLQGSGHRIEAFDLLDTAAIPDWLKRVVSTSGPLSGLVHSAGVHQLIPLPVVSIQNIESVMRANLISSAMLLKAFVQPGCAVHGASVVLLSSVAALVGQPCLAAYSASKAALLALAKSAAMEFARLGVRVNCVAPGTVETQMTERLRERLDPEQFEGIGRMHPLGLGKPRDVAFAIAYLLADTGRWVTGTTLIVDGGYTAH